MAAPWPSRFRRVPDADWVDQPLEALTLNYDTVENHGWHSNLDLTVQQLSDYARAGDIFIDYSGGTGILTTRLLDRLGVRKVGLLIADSSPKFLRHSLERFRDEDRVAFRRIRYLKDEGRLQRLDEVLDRSLLDAGADALLSTNALHLYDDLEETVKAWRRVLKPTGRLFVQSGNVRNPEMPDDEWIIDETVELIHEIAMEIVRDDDQFAAYRDHLGDAEYMAAHDALRRGDFRPVRRLDHYLDTFRQAGFEVTSVRRRRISARVQEWYEFLSVHHEAVLGWLGGAEKVMGTLAESRVVRDRLTLMHHAMEQVFGGAFEFGASWTYITCEPRG